jgi:hypothetical protein
MTIGRGAPLFFTLLLVGAACTKPAQAPPMDSAAVAAAHAGVPMMDPEVRLVAGITLALRAHPEMRDSMYSAYRMTPAGFDSIMARIALDPARKAAYDQAVAPRSTAPAATH